MIRDTQSSWSPASGANASPAVLLPQYARMPPAGDAAGGGGGVALSSR